jgi:methylase of polypeptide subunit release factors
MPRIPHSILLKAYNISPLLPLVVRGSRTLPSAINELRWLKEHAEETYTGKCSTFKQQKLLSLCRRRSKAEPLQYILGSQPFGELDIKCHPGILIPRCVIIIITWMSLTTVRPETEAYTTYLAHLITSHQLDRVLAHKFIPDEEVFTVSKTTPQVKILDLCTGSGCIALLLSFLTSKSHKQISIYGWDVSEEAIGLAKENLIRNINLGHIKMPFHKRPRFEVADIFDSPAKLLYILREKSIRRLSDVPAVDIIVSNPPYISQDALKKETTRSVRNWEPRLALVPPQISSFKESKNIDAADVFYQRLLVLHSEVFGSQILLMEVGDEAQALRVARMAIDYCGNWNHIEIWRDSPNVGNVEEIQYGDHRIPVRGSGLCRAVGLFKFSRSRKSKDR